MTKMLDFTRAKKPTLPVKMPDGTILHVFAPTKRMLEEFIDLDKDLNNALNDDVESIATLYDFVARCLSNNKAGITIDCESLADVFDVGDLIVFARGYAGFIADLKNEKN